MTDSPKSLEHVDVWIFDLDNTLYPAKCDLFKQVDVRMRDYVADFLQVPHEEAYKLQKSYFREHGSTLKGMMENHGVDPHDYLQYVHDIDLSPLPKSQMLSKALEQLPGRKVIFTNGSKGHAYNVMGYMGIDHHFDDCFDIISADFSPKPALATYNRMLQLFDIDPKRAAMVEDMVVNLEPAYHLGMTTVWVKGNEDHGGDGHGQPFIDHIVEDLPEWLAEIVGSR